MTLSECISFVDGIEPNAYTNAQKTQWVSECEGRVFTDIFLRHPDDFTPLDYTTGSQQVLSVKPPHDKLYPRYLQAMVCFANSEYERYSACMALYNDAWGELLRWYARNYSPAEYVDYPSEAADYDYDTAYSGPDESEDEDDA